jgi:hypothetical protein
MMTAAAWETAWGAYVEALAAWERSYPDRHRRGSMRTHKANRKAVIAAACNLRRIDWEFCENQGINLNPFLAE